MALGVLFPRLRNRREGASAAWRLHRSLVAVTAMSDKGTQGKMGQTESSPRVLCNHVGLFVPVQFRCKRAVPFFLFFFQRAPCSLTVLLHHADDFEMLLNCSCFFTMHARSESLAGSTGSCAAQRE